MTSGAPSAFSYAAEAEGRCRHQTRGAVNTLPLQTVRSAAYTAAHARATRRHCAAHRSRSLTVRRACAAAPA